MKMKNSAELKRNWFETKEKLKIKFVKLTDNDFIFVEGRQTEMMDRLQRKLGLPKEEIQKIISDII
ncbi:MAG: general stress protein CsbD [Lutibacter sp.]|nr:general stress protein CsbD [Lutibacter sp.]